MNMNDLVNKALSALTGCLTEDIEKYTDYLISDSKTKKSKYSELNNIEKTIKYLGKQKNNKNNLVDKVLDIANEDIASEDIANEKFDLFDTKNEPLKIENSIIQSNNFTTAVNYDQVKIIADDDYFNNGYFGYSEIRYLMYGRDIFDYKINEEKEQTPSMAEGQAVHKMYLEGEEKFQNDVVIIENTTSKSYAKLKKARDENPEKIVISDEFANTITAMQEVFFNHEEAKKIITSSDIKEFPLNGLLEFEGIKLNVRAKPDIIKIDEANKIIKIFDLKTTSKEECADLDRWKYELRNRDYDLQAFHYLEMVKKYYEKKHNEKYDFVFTHILQFKEPPYAIRIYNLTVEDITSGERKMLKAMNNYNKEVKEYVSN